MEGFTQTRRAAVKKFTFFLSSSPKLAFVDIHATRRERDTHRQRACKSNDALFLDLTQTEPSFIFIGIVALWTTCSNRYLSLFLSLPPLSLCLSPCRLFLSLCHLLQSVSVVCITHERAWQWEERRKKCSGKRVRKTEAGFKQFGKRF